MLRLQMLALVAISPECVDILEALFQPGGNELFLRPMCWLIGKVWCRVNPPTFILLLLLQPCPHPLLLPVGKVLWEKGAQEIPVLCVWCACVCVLVRVRVRVRVCVFVWCDLKGRVQGCCCWGQQAIVVLCCSRPSTWSVCCCLLNHQSAASAHCMTEELQLSPNSVACTIHPSFVRCRRRAWTS